jgi:hypothetical protein
MALTLSPIPAATIGEIQVWRDWFFQIGNNFTNLQHNSINGLQGGDSSGYYHLTSEQASALASGVNGTFTAGTTVVTVTNGIITSIV